uniref:Mucin-5AC-like n=1 Tax=Hirondellea gigas TaxID=1518452 RepID=A0A6A7G6R5_9CRUS
MRRGSYSSPSASAGAFAAGSSSGPHPNTTMSNIPGGGGSGFPPQPGGTNYPPQTGGANYPSQAGGPNYPPQVSGGAVGYPPQPSGTSYPQQPGGTNYAPQTSGGAASYPSHSGGSSYPPAGGGSGYAPASTGGSYQQPPPSVSGYPQTGGSGGYVPHSSGSGYPATGSFPAGGVGGYNKPPPAPAPAGGSFSHTAQARARGRNHGSMGDAAAVSAVERAANKDKYNSSSGGLSCSMPSNREKSPNPGAGASIPDLHDCSMCLAAYIQSLNTVCGSASRLSQCLASLSGHNQQQQQQYSGPASNTYQHIKEACEGWEGLTRAVGVASAAVKSHMLALLQDAAKLSSASNTGQEEQSEAVRKLHMDKLVASLCTSFLSLQCQFSGAVLETFGPYTSMGLPITPPSSIEHSPSLTSLYSTPQTPPYFGSQLNPPPTASSHFPLNNQQNAAAASKARSRTNSINNYLSPYGSQQHIGQNLQLPGYNPAFGGGLGDYSFRRWSMGASGYHNSSNSGGNTNNNSGSSNAVAGDGKLDSNNIAGPGPPRRWSVPEASNEPPPLGGVGVVSGPFWYGAGIGGGGGSGNPHGTGGGNPLAASGNPLAASGNPLAASGNPLAASGNPLAASGNPVVASNMNTAGTSGAGGGGNNAGNWAGMSALTPDVGGGEGGSGGRRLSVPAAGASSRESSNGGTRSNSHSRSATPDPGKSSSSFVSTEELDELVVLFNSFTRSSSSSRRRSSGSGKGKSAGSATPTVDQNTKEGGEGPPTADPNIEGTREPQKSEQNYNVDGINITKPCLKADDISESSPKLDNDNNISVAKEKEPADNNDVAPSASSGNSSTKPSCNHKHGQHSHSHHHHHHTSCHKYHYCCHNRDKSAENNSHQTQSSRHKQENASLSVSESQLDSKSQENKSSPDKTSLQSSSANKKTAPSTSSNAAFNKGSVPKHGAYSSQHQQHSRQRSPFQHHQYNNQQQQYQHMQQMQLQQYLYQQQLQANAFFKLSPISTSILKQQQQYFPFLQQQIYYKHQQQLQMQQIQQIKLNQSLQLLHLQQQQIQQQPRKSSLQNLSSYYQELSSLGALYGEASDDSSASTSRRGSNNTTNSSTSSAGTTRTPVIHEATMEAIEPVDTGPLDARWPQRSGPLTELLASTGNPSMRQFGAPTAAATASGIADQNLVPGDQQQMTAGAVDRSLLASSSAGATSTGVNVQQHQQQNIVIPEVVTTSTPLWPPSGSVPGVTLTECTEELQQQQQMGHTPGWPPADSSSAAASADDDGSGDGRDAASRVSWPSEHPLWGSGGFSLGGLIEDPMSPSKQQEHLHQQQQFMRRHSDTSSFSPYHSTYQQQLQQLGVSGDALQQQQQFQPLPPLCPGRNSRSSDNLHLASDDMNKPSFLDSNLESLLTLNALLPNSSPPSPTAHYSLFSPN